MVGISVHIAAWIAALAQSRWRATYEEIAEGLISTQQLAF
jgi:hypothetical protein